MGKIPSLSYVQDFLTMPQVKDNPSIERPGARSMDLDCKMKRSFAKSTTLSWIVLSSPRVASQATFERPEEMLSYGQPVKAVGNWTFFQLGRNSPSRRFSTTYQIGALASKNCALTSSPTPRVSQLCLSKGQTCSRKSRSARRKTKDLVAGWRSIGKAAIH